MSEAAVKNRHESDEALPKAPGSWYVTYALTAVAFGRTPGHFAIDSRGRDTWVSEDPEWDRQWFPPAVGG